MVWVKIPAWQAWDMTAVGPVRNVVAVIPNTQGCAEDNTG